jgi:transcriptional regulator with GAF, ATPase, and Fis domain
MRNAPTISAADLGLGSERKNAPEPEPDPSSATHERMQIQQALSRANGVVSKAAIELGLSRQALYRRMERLGLSISKRVQ